MVFPIQGDFVWIDTGVGVPIGAEVQVSNSGKLQLIDDEGKVQTAPPHKNPQSISLFWFL